MSSVQSPIRFFWEKCLSETMFLRGRCYKRPSLYYTESGSLVLDARTAATHEQDIINAIFVTCDLIANDYGFNLDVSVSGAGLYIWQKGGVA